MKRASITEDFLQECTKRFRADPKNIVSRNAITSVGATLATTDSNRLNEVSHVFMNTIKKKDLKATNQGHSGRCWMFAGLNMFRHHIINGMDLDNFEFSETYLFFYDKLEMANTFLKWTIDHLDLEPGDRAFDHTMSHSLEDGGWWNCFVNLVEKYGVVPKSGMKETCSSQDSDEMNQIIKNRIHSAANWMRKHPKRDLEKKREEVISLVYKDLVLFLGEPPQEFTWSYTDSEGESTILSGLTPHSFRQMVLPIDDLRDFVSLSNLPISKMKYRERYEILQTNNVHEGDLCTVLNLPIEDLVKYAKQSILKGFPVWFVGDVSQYFHPWYSTLDDALMSEDPVFGAPDTGYKKGDRLQLMTLEGNHAMSLTGVNVDSKGVPISWQVENSWGYYDNETPGEDGWLTMSASWFKKYVTEIVVHKNFLSRSTRKLLKKKPISVNPWDCMAPALRAGCVNPPSAWKKRLENGKKNKK